MKTVLIVFLVAAYSLRIAISEESADSSARAGEVAFIASTNGTFHVATFDPDKRVFLRWNGIQVWRRDLPKASIRRSVRIYEKGERPVYDRNSPEALNPPPEYYHHYGPISYPIIDVDPPIEYCLDAEDNLLIGFSLRGTFYVIKKEKTPSLKKTPAKKYWSKVIHVSPPAHRKKELQDLDEQWLKHTSSTTNAEGK